MFRYKNSYLLAMAGMGKFLLFETNKGVPFVSKLGSNPSMVCSMNLISFILKTVSNYILIIFTYYYYDKS